MATRQAMAATELGGDPVLEERDVPESGVRPMIETMSLGRAARACDRMKSGDARLRMVPRVAS